MTFLQVLTMAHGFALFLGYDPGGHDKHGIAAASIKPDGSFAEEPKTDVVADAAAALEWFSHHKGAVALGIDTLLAWSLSGRRACDDWLRSTYHGRGGGSVIPQNSLYSSMTLNGVMVATRIVPRLILCESHPKLLRKALLLGEHLRRHVESDEHAYDALVAAWCASRWFHRAWTRNLFEPKSDDMVFPAGDAVYPWPDPTRS